MESLKFYVKENILLFILYCLCILLNIGFCIFGIYTFTKGYLYATVAFFGVCSSIFLPFIITRFSKVKHLISVYSDYKKQEQETKTIYVKRQDYQQCLAKHNGAYKNYYCSECLNGDEVLYWIYRKSLIYDDVCIGEQYRITYYKKSKCLCSIQPVLNNCNINKKKPKKSIKLQKKKKIEKQNTTEKIMTKINKKTVSEKIVVLGIPFNTRDEDFIIAGVPYEAWSSYSHNKRLFLKTKNEKGRKKDLVLYGTDILGLGDLNDRTGYMGYGNFIGTKYDVEYYKHSRVIKSMKLIEDGEPNQTNY